MSDLLSSGLPSSRRGFLRRSAALAIALPSAAELLSGCAESEASKAPDVQKASEHSPAATPAAPLSPRARADAMDAMHEKGVKAFPAKTRGKGNVLLAPKLKDGVKV